MIVGKQLTLAFPKKGGRRPGAGRPRIHERPGLVGPGVSHLEREKFVSLKAVHVTQRIRPAVGYLRKQRPAKVLLQAFKDASESGRMRIAHYSIQGNHLHLVVEAEDAVALSRGIQGLAVRVARRLNRCLGRRGPVFADRYHSRVLDSRRALANAVRYVVNNYRHHTREYLPDDFRDPLATMPDGPLVLAEALVASRWMARGARAQARSVRAAVTPGVATSRVSPKLSSRGSA
jgi:putative transposase